MAEITEHDYETITATCDHCAVTSIFNRLEDIGRPGPYAGEWIVCPACSERFQVTADIVNAKFELFLWDADRQFQAKRYMLAVAALGQAWEAFLAEFVYSTYLWWPFFASSSVDIHRLRRLNERIAGALRKLPFVKLRNIVASTIIRQIEPQDLDAAQVAVEQLEGDDVRNMPPKTAIDGVADTIARDLVTALLSLKTPDLRNRVVHHDAYRPTRAEVSHCIDDEVRFLYRLKRHFGIGTALEHQTRQTRRGKKAG